MVCSLPVRFLFSLAVLLGLVVFAPIGRADTLSALDLLDAKAEFAADYKLHLEGRGDYMGTVVHAPGQERRAFDTSKGQQVLIIRRDLGAVSMLWPANKNFLSVPISMASPYIGDIETLKLDRTLMGTETIDGEICTVYSVKVQSDDNNFNGKMWFTKDGILMKAAGHVIVDGQKRAIRTELSQLIRAAADPILFDIPADYWGIPLKAGAIDFMRR